MFASGAHERSGMTIIFIIVCLLGIALSIKSLIVLGSAAPWTSAGWWLTVVYFVAVSVKAAGAYPVSSYLEYGVLAALAIAFVVAGVRDERQAQPWWWPTERSGTRAEKRRAA
jgi:hypothetical protein